MNWIFPVVPTDPLSSALSSSSATNTPWNTQEAPDDPEPAGEGGIQMEYCSDKLYSPSVEAVTKKLPISN